MIRLVCAFAVAALALTGMGYLGYQLIHLRNYPTSIPGLEKLPGNLVVGAESSPVIVKGKVAVVVSHRNGWDGTELEFLDFDTGKPISPALTWPYAFGSAINDQDDILVFGSRPLENGTEIGFLRLSQDLKQKETRSLFIAFDKIANTSVVYDGQRYVMALELETPDGGQFHPRFAASPDLVKWKPVGVPFRPDEYTACPTIKKIGDWYYIFYLASQKLPDTKALPSQDYGFTTKVSRTKDFEEYQTTRLFRLPTLLAPDEDEGVNASDLDLIEFDGKTYLTYNAGDQTTIGHIKRALFPGTMEEMLQELWP